MAIIITDKFQLRQKNFLDDRQGIASSVSALKSWNYSSVPIPEGFEVYVGGVWYTYRSSNPDDPVTGRFKTRTNDEGVDDLKVRVTRLEFEDGRDVAQTFAQIKTEAFWKDSTGVSHARAGRIVTVTSDGANNGSWYLISSDYTKTENWIKLIGRGDLVTTTGGAAVSDTSVYTSAKIDATFPKKVSTENITAKWIFKENQVFEKDLTIAGKLTSTGETVLKEAKIGTNGSIKDEDGKTVARINKIVADESEIEDLDQHIRDQMGLIGVGNLLRNTSFFGQFESKEMDSDTGLGSKTIVYNSRIDDWDVTTLDWEIQDDADSITGLSMRLKNPTSMISQETSLSLSAGASYILSWKQKGQIEVEVPGYDLEIQTILQTSRYKFCYTKIVSVANRKERIFFKGGPGNVFEIKLEEGILPTTWFPSCVDTDPVAARADSYEFLKSSLIEHPETNSTIVSGLFLKDQIKVGDITNDVVRNVWGGLSGVFNDESDIMLWSGGSYGNAVDLISKINNNPSYLDDLPESVLRGLTKAIITFGSKTIFTDLYATGKFKGKHLDSEGAEITSFNKVTGFLPSDAGKIGFTAGRLNRVNGTYPTSINFGGTTITFSSGYCTNQEGQYTINTGEAISGVTQLHLIFHKGYLVKVSSVKDYNSTYYWFS